MNTPANCGACGLEWPYRNCPAGCGTEEELKAAKRIIERLIPKRDDLTVEQLIRGELGK